MFYKILIIICSIIYAVNFIFGYLFFKSLLSIFGRFKKIREFIVQRMKTAFLNCTIAYGSLFFKKDIYVILEKNVLDKIMDKKLTKNNFITISNHLTNYDWLIILLVLDFLSLYKNTIIILKHSLSKIPIFGDGMKIFNFLFLKRNFEDDKKEIEKGIKNIEKDVNFLMFPEGTIFTEFEDKKCQKYLSEKNNLKNHQSDQNEFENKSHNLKSNIELFDNLLIPRKKGTNLILNNLDCSCLNVTLFTYPYFKYPQDKFPYSSVYFNDVGKIGFFMIVELEKIQKNIENDNFKDHSNWLLNLWQKKQNLFNIYKKSDLNNPSKKDFEILTQKMVSDSKNYEIIILNFCRKKNFFYLMLFFMNCWIVYQIFRFF